MTKQEVKKVVESNISLYDLIDGRNIDSLIETLEEYKDKYSSVYSDLYLSLDYSYEDGVNYVSLMGTRLETDEEYQKRRTKEKLEKEKKKAQKEKQKSDEYQKYLQLKEKYEKDE